MEEQVRENAEQRAALERKLKDADLKINEQGRVMSKINDDEMFQ